MFKTILKALNQTLDIILPLRSDFEIVKNLDEEKIYSLPRSQKIEKFDWIYPLFSYKDRRVRAIIWELKYRENTLPLETIGKMIFDEILDVLSDIILFNADAEFLIIPVPMTENSKALRGYNQSELIAKAIITNDLERRLLYAPQWFFKIKETPKQSRSETKIQREINLVDCFSADPRVKGKFIFLIDDVVTTGSTLSEARKTLLNTGAQDVLAFTIGH